MDDDNNKSRNLVPNLVIPTLLQIMSQSIPFVDDNVVVKRQCAVTLLAFGHARMNPQDFVHVIAPILTFQNVSLNIDTDWLEWNEVELNGTAWDDPVTNIATRAAQQCWNALLESKSDYVGVTKADDNNDVKRRVLQQLGWREMATAVRAHFFGRDENETTTVSKSTWQYPLPQVPQPLPNEPIEMRPSRVHVAMQFIFLSNTMSVAVLQQVLPILYALLDTTSKHVAMGASALLHIYTLVTRESLQEFQETLLQVLDRAVMTTRKGPAVLLVALAQSRVFEILQDCKVQRRQVTQQMLIILKRNCAQDSVSLLLGLLAGGIIPLLKQLAEEPNADAMELGRLGLTTLLFALKGFNVSVQAAALMALIYLMLGAYPIMPRHGGVIMSHVLACLGRAGDSGSVVGLEKVGVTAAAMALIVCGEGAVAVLEKIDENADKYETKLVLQVSSIREEALQLQEASV